MSIEDRFWAKVTKLGPDDCWKWQGRCDSKMGYGNFDHPGVGKLAHRYSWKLHHGNIGNLCVLHECDNPPCVNPSHLFLGTKQDNNADCKAKRILENVIHTILLILS